MWRRHLHISFFQICQRNGKLVWLVVGWCRCWNPDMQHSSLSLCLKSLSQMAPLLLLLSTCKLYYSLLFSADIVLIVCMTTRCMDWTQVDELAPCVRFIIYRDTAFLLLCSSILLENSGAKCEFLCKMSSAPWLWSCSNFFLCWLTQLYFSAGIWGHIKPYCSHKFEMHTHDNLFHW
jgi:hypothetical protein